MSDYREQGLENDNNPLETISKMDLNMEDTVMIDDCLKSIEIENGNRTCSKDTLLPLDNKKIPMTDDSENLTQNVICQLHDLVLNASSTTFNVLTDQCQNDIEQVKEDQNMLEKIDPYSSDDINCEETSNPRGKEDIVPIIIDKKKSDNSTMKKQIKNNISRVRQHNELPINNVYQEKGLKRPNSNPCMDEKLNKKSKSCPAIFVGSKYNTKSFFKCKKSPIERKRNNIDKKQKELKKHGQNRKDRDQKTKNNEKKLRKITGKLQLKDRKPQRKCQNNNTHCKQARKTNSVTSIKKTSSVSYYSSCVFCNKKHEFHRRNSKLRRQLKQKIPTEKKNVSWCVIM